MATTVRRGPQFIFNFSSHRFIVTIFKLVEKLRKCLENSAQHQDSESDSLHFLPMARPLFAVSGAQQSHSGATLSTDLSSSEQL